MEPLNMSHFLDGVDTTYYVTNLTDAIKSRSELVCSPVGFYLHKVKIKRKIALVKVYNGLSPKAITPAIKKEMFNEIMRGLALWNQFCRSGTNFANLLGWCDSVDSVLPCPVYQESAVAKDYLQKQKDVNLMDFFLGIAKGLDYLHSLGYSHGDMRADNIFVGDDGEPRITDFGLPRIRLMLEKIGLGADPDNDISAIRWMPVEFIQLDDEAVHEPTKPGDVWSFGMSMFELWSGKVPYYETKLELVPLKINRGSYPRFPAPGFVKHEFEAKPTPFKLDTNAHGEPHLAQWTSICLIDSVQYGQSTNRNKKKAEDEASRQALMRLRA
ncbi:hypothetical protein M0805_001267 [Coniferiporia weirii]|nr:hypothetical protein M0805_001267 [Coniferiporia weirii]